jgi:hypothetical protein
MRGKRGISTTSLGPGRKIPGGAVSLARDRCRVAHPSRDDDHRRWDPGAARHAARVERISRANAVDSSYVDLKRTGTRSAPIDATWWPFDRTRVSGRKCAPRAGRRLPLPSHGVPYWRPRSSPASPARARRPVPAHRRKTPRQGMGALDPPPPMPQRRAYPPLTRRRTWRRHPRPAAARPAGRRPRRAEVARIPPERYPTSALTCSSSIRRCRWLRSKASSTWSMA